MRGRRRIAWLAALSLGLGGCDWYYNTLPSPDELWYLISWFDHMQTSLAYHPYESDSIPRTPVPGTVPIDAAEPDWIAEWSRANTATADRLVNPTDPIATFARGDTLYQVFCTVCHGSQGAGDGTVSRRVGAPSLLTDRARTLSDGNIYSIIRYGRGVMPRYGDKIVEPEHRWAVVNYVRFLQGGGAAPGGGR